MDLNHRSLDVIKSPDDSRDRKLSAAPLLSTAAKDMPVNFIIDESKYLKVWNQEDSGACAAYTTAGAFAILLRQTDCDSLDPSRLYIYSQAKFFDNQDYTADDGLYMRDACGVLRLLGTCSDKTWPFTAANFTRRPPVAAINEAAKYGRRLAYYLANPALPVLKYILFDLKAPISMGFSIYDNFEPDSNGLIPIPDPAVNKLLGGHAVLIVGYDESKNAFLARNSWGKDWGVNGHCYIPYQFVLDSKITFELRFFQPTNEFVGNENSQQKTADAQKLVYSHYLIIFIVILSFCLAVIALLYYYLWIPNRTRLHSNIIPSR